ncbi:hypothetical protein IEZ26_14985 [Nocardioides cavernae]|uniref:YfhO family protein n=1 Tax=Nocardioides cavernae TaxID=1921566 RepID=A0ABR8NCR6_9ACTN|nr:hypothetical protein [Nocardioides cavernae]MBD3925929.1 hypothetical protein [Nocardioides cavernae]MBM7513515.1 hypothetical protein [Nocardioides cavernae]
MGARVDWATARTRGLLLPTVWAAVLAVLLLGGALGRGYVLSYDMVWVPDLRLGADALGLGSALPRAVPSDAVVAVLDEVLGGMLLQKLVLLLPLVAAGSGAAALVGPGVVARLVAASVAIWNPFVVERLAIGHWPVLVGYGVLPWVVLAGAAWRTSGVLPARLPVLLVFGSLSASTGIVTGVAACAAAAPRGWRHRLALATLLVLANLPWLASGLLHAGSATSSADGADVFAPSGGGLLPGPLAFVSLGGIWNAQVVLPSRSGALAVITTVVLVALALLGARRGWSKVPQELRRPLVMCWVIGLTVTVATWALPGATGWLASTVPGAGLLRDGSRLLALAAPLTAVLAGRGADALVHALPDAFSRAMIALACVLVPVALMPDATLGLSGRLAAVDYPDSYDELVAELRSLPPGDVALLPFQSYRAPSWNNDGRPVLAPLGRYLPRRVVVEDRLVVDGRPLAGEDPTAAAVRRALESSDAQVRSAGLREAGIRLVVVEQLPAVEVPDIEGDVVWQLDGLSVIDLGPAASEVGARAAWVVAMSLAWCGWCGLLVFAAFAWLRRAGQRVAA